LLSLDMDPFYDEKAKYLIEAITSKEVLKLTRKYLNNPCISVSGSKHVCEYLRKIWERKY